MELTDRPHIVRMQTVPSNDATISVLELGQGLPFTPRRIYLLHSVGPEAIRGNHAHKTLAQVLIAAAGSFRVTVQHNGARTIFRLDSPELGLVIPPMSWREIDEFSVGSSCLVLASEVYSEKDYIRNFEDFQTLTQTATETP